MSEMSESREFCERWTGKKLGDGEPSSAPPAKLLSAEQIAQKLANVGGIERWRLILEEWLDSYIAIWKEEESIWRGAEEEVSPPSPELQKEL